MLVDFGIILPLSFFLSETKPVAKLGTTLPNANLLSKSFALVILLQVIKVSAIPFFQRLNYLMSYAEYCCDFLDARTVTVDPIHSGMETVFCYS